MKNIHYANPCDLKCSQCKSNQKNIMQNIGKIFFTFQKAGLSGQKRTKWASVAAVTWSHDLNWLQHSSSITLAPVQAWRQLHVVAWRSRRPEKTRQGSLEIPSPGELRTVQRSNGATSEWTVTGWFDRRHKVVKNAKTQNLVHGHIRPTLV